MKLESGLNDRVLFQIRRIKNAPFHPQNALQWGVRPIKAYIRSRTTVTIRIQRGTSCSPVFIKPWCRHTSSVPLNRCVRSYVSVPKLIKVSIWRVYTKSSGEIFILDGMSQIQPLWNQIGLLIEKWGSRHKTLWRLHFTQPTRKFVILIILYCKCAVIRKWCWSWGWQA